MVSRGMAGERAQARNWMLSGVPQIVYVYNFLIVTVNGMFLAR